MAEAWRQHEPEARTAPRLAEVPELPVADIEAALGEWAAHRDEIDTLVADRLADADAALAAWEQRRALRAV